MLKASANRRNWALAIDVDYTALVDDDSSGLQSLIGSIVNLTDDLAEQLMNLSSAKASKNLEFFSLCLSQGNLDRNLSSAKASRNLKFFSLCLSQRT